MRNKVLCKVKEKDRAAMEELIEVAQPLLKLIQKCCEDDIKKLNVIEDDDYTNPAFPILRAYKELPIFKGRMDATGIGRPIYESLHKKLGDRLERVVFTPEEKEIITI